MKKCRADFRKELSFCRANELAIRKEKLVSSFGCRDKTKFWSEVRKMKPKPKITTIDGISDKNKVLEIFKSQYKQIFDDDRCQTLNDRIQSHAISGQLNHVYFLPAKIENCIHSLNNGLGYDMIHSNHIKFSGKGFVEFLGKLFAAMTKHCFIPKEMLRGQIRPHLKDGSICKMKSSSYRPVTNSCMVLKVFEYSLLPVLKSNLKISSNQFGFTKGSSCGAAITVLKETLISFKEKSSNIHCASIDLSKAFDRININILSKKLSNSTLPVNIQRLLHYMLSQTYVNVKFSNCIGEEWIIKNGVRQGGILSTILFNFYINSCLETTLNMNIGCFLSGMNVSVIGYADDILILAPSKSGLELLLGNLFEKLTSDGLIVNYDKCSYIVFRHKRNVCSRESVVINSVEIQRVTTLKYLGVLLDEDLDLECDIERVTNSFLKVFFSFLSDV